MARYHHISSLEDEENLLKNIIQLEEKILKQKEYNRKRKNAQNEKYSGIFEPITKSIQMINQPAKIENNIEPNDEKESKIEILTIVRDRQTN